MDLPTLTMSASNGWLDQRERFSANIAGEEQKNYTLLRRGQLSYNHGNSKLAKYGVVFELRNYEEALVPRVYHSFETNRETQATFLEYLFATKLPERELGKLVSSGARMDGLLNISYDDFMSIKVVIPIIQEQQKIGSFFTALDRLITTHQRKLENVKKLKKSLLQKMFPKNGQEFPEIRFPEFTDAWEQKRLNDLAKPIKSYPLSRSVETTNNTNFRYIHYGDIHRGIANIIDNITVLPNISGEYSETLEFGDIVVADASEDYNGVAAPCVINCIYKENIIAGLHTIAIRPNKSHPLFLYYLLHTSTFKEYCKKIGTGTKVFAITAKNLLAFETIFPIYEEQQKIGSFFTALDRLISSHQRKLENMKKLKKALLQRMFV